MNSVVIGSGFGGIAAALRLKAKGHKVKLIEKHPDLGGRARVFKRNGFTYDGGPTVITAPYLINELFELFNKDPKDYIELSPLKVWYQFVFEDNSKFNYSGDETEMKKQIEEINKDDAIINSTGMISNVVVSVDGDDFEFELSSQGKSILDAAMDAGADVPFSCKGGVCCVCKAKVIEGEVSMDANYSLSEDEVEQGYILTCQSHPLSEDLVVDFDEI